MEEKLEKPEILGVIASKARRYGMSAMLEKMAKGVDPLNNGAEEGLTKSVFRKVMDDLDAKKKADPEYNIFTGGTGFKEFDKAMKDYQKRMEEHLFYGTAGGPAAKERIMVERMVKMNEDELMDIPPSERMRVVKEYVDNLPPGQQDHIRKQVEMEMALEQPYAGKLYDEKLLQELRDFQTLETHRSMMLDMSQPPNPPILGDAFGRGDGILEQIEKNASMNTYKIGGMKLHMKLNELFDGPSQP